MAEHQGEHEALARVREQVETVERGWAPMPVPERTLICLRYEEARALLDDLDARTRPGAQ